MSFVVLCAYRGCNKKATPMKPRPYCHGCSHPGCNNGANLGHHPGCCPEHSTWCIQNGKGPKIVPYCTTCAARPCYYIQSKQRYSSQCGQCYAQAQAQSANFVPVPGQFVAPKAPNFRGMCNQCGRNPSWPGQQVCSTICYQRQGQGHRQ